MKNNRSKIIHRVVVLLLAALLSGGCVLVDRADAEAQEVIRAAGGEAVVLPADWEWAR